jgi:branched-chain amino acid transport system substrate-binding protein
MRIAFRALLALLAFAVVMTSAPPRASAQQEPYTIDVILPLTGAGAFIGQTHQKALQILEALTNKRGGIKGQPIRFAFHDDQSSPQVALQLTNTVLEKKPAVIMGSVLTAMCRAMEPVLASGPVDYCLSPGVHPPKGSFVFSASVAATDLVGVTIRYFRERGWKKIARLSTTDASGQDADAAFAKALALPENKDVQVVANEHFAVADTSASAQAAKIKAATPDALIIWASGTAFGTALHAVHDNGLDVPTATSASTFIFSQIKQYTAFVPKDLYFQGPSYTAAIPRSPRSKQSLDEFLAAMKENAIPLDFQSGLAWDPALIIVDALRHLGNKASAEQIRAYIAQLHDFPGISGTYDFRIEGDQRGLTENDLMMLRWDNAKFVWAPVSKFGGLLR